MTDLAVIILVPVGCAAYALASYWLFRRWLDRRYSK